MFKRKSAIARHNDKCCKRLRKFSRQHPTLTGAACTIGGINFVYRVAVAPLIHAYAAAQITPTVLNAVNDAVKDIVDVEYH